MEEQIRIGGKKQKETCNPSWDPLSSLSYLIWSSKNSGPEVTISAPLKTLRSLGIEEKGRGSPFTDTRALRGHRPASQRGTCHLLSQELLWEMGPAERVRMGRATSLKSLLQWEVLLTFPDCSKSLSVVTQLSCTPPNLTNEDVGAQRFLNMPGSANH